ncbi:MAG: ribonuclease P protein component [Sphingobium sp.]|nr:ribonuclease P protein component [Sphingobium sp.]
MRKRADFLACNRGRRQPMPGFVLLMRERKDDNPATRLGITVTKKIGGAVVRNRMKRRFRALARAILPHQGISGTDYVLIGRAGGVEREYSSLVKELEKALRRLQAPETGENHTSSGAKRSHRPPSGDQPPPRKSHAHKGRGKGRGAGFQAGQPAKPHSADNATLSPDNKTSQP